MARDDAPIVAWEPATGTGAVAVALALRYREAIALGRLRLIASDLSADALELAAENLEVHGVAPLVDLACADLLEPAGARCRAQTSWSPTCRTCRRTRSGRRAAVSTTSRLIALDGGSDGLAVFRRMLAMAGDHLAPGGTLLLEIGAGQAEELRALAPPGASVAVTRDLAGLERVVRIGLEEPT